MENRLLVKKVHQEEDLHLLRRSLRKAGTKAKMTEDRDLRGKKNDWQMLEKETELNQKPSIRMSKSYITSLCGAIV
jgi:hypothetical protein